MLGKTYAYAYKVKLIMGTHVIKKYILCHKKTSNEVFEIAFYLCNKNQTNLAVKKYFSIIKTVSFSNIFLASGNLKIASLKNN